MITLAEAQERLLKLAAPLGDEINGLGDAAGRFLAKDIHAKRTQPAKDLSAMDGYAIAHKDFPGPWLIVGEAAAGGHFTSDVKAGQAVRIFTGAPLPGGTDTILIQEDSVVEADKLSPLEDVSLENGRHVRLAGSDFSIGDRLIEAGTRLNAAHVGLAAIAGHADLPLYRLPRISIFQTGDELAGIGEPVGDDQIPASNGPMLTAMLANISCKVVQNHILPDNMERIRAAIEVADTDVIVTVGGASVGDHDLVRPALEASGAELDFWKVAMRPGKPVMAGKFGDTVILGLPGNPVSAYVTAFHFLLPLLRHLGGNAHPFPARRHARIASALPANDARANFIRAVIRDGFVTPLPSKDSAILLSLSRANALVHRPAFAPACAQNDEVEYFALD